ncbi:lysostaphin resistance A-like protein [Psychrobacillus sp. NPDC096426]|uniref:CPBP family intramembrane glutamic endopeptidase n=1 Tax=Psychrobacillus sp. NPDC096426 TaxID=3364491 RepID=UPI00381A8970
MKKNFGYALLIYFCSLLLLDLMVYIFNLNTRLLEVLSYIIFPLLLITIIYLLKEDLKLKVFEKEKSSVKKTILVICMSFFFAFAGIMIITFVKSFFDTPNENITANDINTSPYMFIPIVLLGPLVEELVFRRMILHVFSKKFNIFISIILTSFLFSSWHFSILSFPHLFWISIVFSYSYYLTNRLSVPIILHIIWNLLPILLFNFGSIVGII